MTDACTGTVGGAKVGCSETPTSMPLLVSCQINVVACAFHRAPSPCRKSSAGRIKPQNHCCRHWRQLRGRHSSHRSRILGSHKKRRAPRCLQRRTPSCRRSWRRPASWCDGHSLLCMNSWSFCRIQTALHIISAGALHPDDSRCVFHPPKIQQTIPKNAYLIIFVGSHFLL